MIKKAFSETLEIQKNLVDEERLQNDYSKIIDEFLEREKIQEITISAIAKEGKYISLENRIKRFKDEKKVLEQESKEFMENKNIEWSKDFLPKLIKSYNDIHLGYLSNLKGKLEQWRSEHPNANELELTNAEVTLARQVQDEMGFDDSKPRQTPQKVRAKRKSNINEECLRKTGEIHDIRLPNSKMKEKVGNLLNQFIDCWKSLIKQHKISLPLKEGESMDALTPKGHEEIVRGMQKLAHQNKLTFPSVLHAAYHTYKHSENLSKEDIGEVINQMNDFSLNLSESIIKSANNKNIGKASDISNDLIQQIKQYFTSHNQINEDSKKWQLARNQVKRFLWLWIHDYSDKWKEQSVTYDQAMKCLLTRIKKLTNKWQRQSVVENQVERYLLKIKLAIVNPKQDISSIARTHRFDQYGQFIDYNFSLGDTYHKMIVRVDIKGAVTVRTCF